MSVAQGACHVKRLEASDLPHLVKWLCNEPWTGTSLYLRQMAHEASRRGKWKEDEAVFARLGEAAGWGEAQGVIWICNRTEDSNGGADGKNLSQAACYMHTTDEAAGKYLLQEAAAQGALPWGQQGLIFPAALEHLHRCISEAATAAGAARTGFNPCVLLVRDGDCPREAAHEGIRVGGLRVQDAELVNDNWPHRGTVSLFRVRRQIGTHISAAVWREEELVAWTLEQDGGPIGMLHVMENARRRGYAKLVVCELAARMRDQQASGERVCPPYAFALVTNEASITLFKQLNFTVESTVSWMQFQPAEPA